MRFDELEIGDVFTRYGDAHIKTGESTWYSLDTNSVHELDEPKMECKRLRLTHLEVRRKQIKVRGGVGFSDIRPGDVVKLGGEHDPHEHEYLGVNKLTGAHYIRTDAVGVCEVSEGTRPYTVGWGDSPAKLMMTPISRLLVSEDGERVAVGDTGVIFTSNETYQNALENNDFDLDDYYVAEVVDYAVELHDSEDA